MLVVKPGINAPPNAGWIGIPVPAIVEDEVFEQVQEKLARNQQMAPRNNKRYQYLLRGLVSCGLCRLSASARTVNGQYPYYVCRGHSNSLQLSQAERCTARFIPSQQLDTLVWADLCAILTNPEMIAHALERARGGDWLPQELQARIATLRKVDKQLEGQRTRLLDAYLAEVLSLAEFERKQAELDKKQQAIQVQQSQLEAMATEQLELSTIALSIDAFCTQIQPVLAQANFAQKRQLVELLIDRVVVTDEKVEIRYVIPTRPEGPHHPFSHLCTDYLGPHTNAIQAQQVRRIRRSPRADTRVRHFLFPSAG